MATLRTIGSSEDYTMADALWTCSNMFASCSVKLASRRILLFTNNDHPHSTDVALQVSAEDGCLGSLTLLLQRQAQTKARDLRSIGVSIDLLPLPKPGQHFDTTRFYSDIVEVRKRK